MNWSVSSGDVKRYRYRKVGATLAVVMTLSCACASKAPGSLTPEGVRYWQGNEAVIALGAVQRAAIGLNDIEVCTAPPAVPDCHPLLSEPNTRLVVEVVSTALRTMRAVPAGWRVSATTALDSIAKQLDAAGRTKLAAYLTAARAVIGAIS